MKPAARIQAAEYSAVQRFAGAAARERVAITDTARTSWYTVCGPGQAAVDGCAGILWLGRAARIKGVYVAPEMRGAGLGTQLTEHCIAEAWRRGDVDQVEAFALNPAWYESRGFHREGRNSHGVARMVLRREEHPS